MHRPLIHAWALILCTPVLLVWAQENAALELQKNKLKEFARMDGTWRGDAWMMTPTGERIEMTQTERVGTMLGGAIRVIEGRGFDASDNQVFHAFAIISYDAQKDQFTMRSYAQGRQGDFPMEPTEKGFAWSIPMGPATIRYSATIEDGQWHEAGERIVGDAAPVKFLEMSLRRIGDTDWPAAGAVPPK